MQRQTFALGLGLALLLAGHARAAGKKPTCAKEQRWDVETKKCVTAESAEECISKIDAAVRAGIAGEVIEAGFLGGSLYSTTKSSGVEYYAQYVKRDIPWAKLSKVLITPNNVDAYFDAPIPESRSSVFKGDAPKTTAGDSKYDYFSFVVPDAEAERVKACVLRLGELAKQNRWQPAPTPEFPSKAFAGIVNSAGKSSEPVVSGPSAQETKDYINSRAKVCAGRHEPDIAAFNQALIIPYAYAEGDPTDIKGIFVIDWPDLKEVMVRPGRTDSVAGLVIDANARVYQRTYREADMTFKGGYYEKTETRSQVSTYLLPECTPHDVELLAKAIRHMAELKGAKQKKDLFE